MKTNMTRKTFALGLFLMLTLGLQAAGSWKVTKNKEYNQSFNVGQGDRLSVDNRYGSVTVVPWEKSEVAFRVVVTSKAGNERDAQANLDRIQIALNKAGHLVSGITTLGNSSWKTGQSSYSIDYYVNIPADLAMAVSQKYGDINLPSPLDGDCALNVKYGKLNASDFSKPLSVEAAYSTLNLGNAPKLALEISYCDKSQLGNIGELNIESKYSGLKVGQVDRLALEDKYGKTQVGSAKTVAVESKYSDFSLGELSDKLTAETKYSHLSVGRLDAGFSTVNVEAEYSDYQFSVPEEAAFKVEALNMNYGKANVDLKNVQSSTKNKVNHYFEVNGGQGGLIHFDNEGYSNLQIKGL
ncbi:MAG: hypothetical protein LBL81_05320 [Tannerella sp.]|jgi:hypothetical protein|nr:hypothetical protein [Tannerella sp.]